MAHFLDWVYLASTLNQPLFAEGWGDIFQMKALSPQSLDEIEEISMTSDEPWTTIPNGYFKHVSFSSPYKHENFPKECSLVPAAIYSPHKNLKKIKKLVILIPASGDEGYTQRTPVARMLLREGISSVMAEGPFYGKRRPEGQTGPCLRTVGDLGHLGLATVAESRSIAAYFRKSGTKSIGYAGISRGGQLAVMAASVTRFELAVTSLVGSFSAAPIFTKGLMSKRVVWDGLPHPRGSQDAMAEALEFSNVYHYPRPVSPKKISIIGANSDGYVEPAWVESLHRYVPDSDICWVPGGHVSAYVFSRRLYARAIAKVLG